MSISEKNKNLLLAKSGGRCANPECNSELFHFFESGKGSSIVELAHIIARSDNGPRGDFEMDFTDKDHFDNIIVLCPTCHTKVDKNPDEYPVEKLIEWKKEHIHRLDVAFSNPKKEFIDLAKKQEEILQKVNELTSPEIILETIELSQDRKEFIICIRNEGNALEVNIFIELNYNTPGGNGAVCRIAELAKSARYPLHIPVFPHFESAMVQNGSWKVDYEEFKKKFYAEEICLIVNVRLKSGRNITLESKDFSKSYTIICTPQKLTFIKD